MKKQNKEKNVLKKMTVHIYVLTWGHFEDEYRTLNVSEKCASSIKQ